MRNVMFSTQILPGLEKDRNAMTLRRPFLCILPAVLLFLGSMVFMASPVQAAPANITIKPYGSLSKTLDERAFKNALEDWVRQCNHALNEFQQMSDNVADRAFMGKNDTLRKLEEDNGHMARLQRVASPVLLRWQRHGDSDKLRPEDRKVLAVLKQYYIVPESEEGTPFLVFDRAAFNERLVPYLSPALSAYLKVHDSQPQRFFSDAACLYSVKQMGDWAVEWERFIAANQHSQYRDEAQKRYHFFMDYILFSELDNTPAFPRRTRGRMEQSWIGELLTVAVMNTGTRTAAIVNDYLSSLKNNDYKLTKGIKQEFSHAIDAPFRYRNDPETKRPGSQGPGK
jgi:hypothetical protein